jgi:hypothetical protein
MADAPNFLGILQVLVQHEVDFIVVGGVAAILEGAPIATFDLDVVHNTSTANVDRLVEALQELEAIYRDPAGRRIEPDSSRLAGTGTHLLSTRFGPLDIMGTIGRAATFEKLLNRSDEIELAGLPPVRVLRLEAVIESKEEANRDKDRAVLPVLRQTLQMKRQQRES